MRYPTLSLPAAREYLMGWLQGNAKEEPEVTWVGDGELVDEGAIASFARSLTALQRKSADLKGKKQQRYEHFEAAGAELVYEFASTYDPDVLMDCGFWCYLSVHHLRDAIRWRHPGTARSLPALSNFAADQTKLREALLVRMYLRGSLGVRVEDGDFTLSAVEGQDLWRSHIIRVRIGDAPHMTHAVLELVETYEPTVETIREWAKRLTEIRSNVLFELLSPDEARSLAEQQLMAVDPSLSAA